ncbi:MAG: enoyl-CoA hydratase-related protein [Bacteroidia bacterium]|nr:enoyl-CoA hydratase-related protein [Bacteroidia bacterium]
MDYRYLLVDPQAAPGVALITLNRPEALNALCHGLMEELAAVLDAFDRDDAVRCTVLAGSDKAFAAGADIKEMAGQGAVDMLLADRFRTWDRIRSVKKPIVAAVSGFALGGGCELCMSCDLIVASETARFGQPEIKIGVIPGAGGTQRLTRAIGKARAMEYILTGKFFTAQDALAWGLVSRVTAADAWLSEALALAGEIASMPPVAVRLAKESVLQAHTALLDAGLDTERRNFYALFATEDQKEGMQAFVEKRKPVWKGR